MAFRVYGFRWGLGFRVLGFIVFRVYRVSDGVWGLGGGGGPLGL